MDKEQISLIISLISVIAAIVAIYLALKQSKESKEQLNAANQIIESLSTKFIGQFPFYNYEIANLISRAKRSVHLLYDLPGYGLVSDHNAAIDIVKEIETKIKKDNSISVSISVYSSEMRKKVIHEQLKNDNFEQWKNSEQMKPKLINFLSSYSENIQLDDLKMEDYVNLSEAEHEKIVTSNFRGSSRTYVKELLPLYFWMIDETEAIISIPSFAEGISEYGFSTNDSSLIEALLKMKTRYEN